MKNSKIVMFIAACSFSLALVQMLTYASFGRTTKPEAQISETDKGVGPFKDVKLVPIDQVKVKKGLTIFMQKCFLCHDLDNKKLAPPLRNITKVDTPEFILNMIVNPAEMQKLNPKIKEQMKKYNNLPMLDQQVSQQDALNILDYLRSVTK